jgi:hypothetical protein
MEVDDGTGNMSIISHDIDVDEVLRAINADPEKLRVRDGSGNLPIHVECKNQCRSTAISKLIELYPESLGEMGEENYLPLLCLLSNMASSVEDALMMIEKHPAALQHRNELGSLPLHLECRKQGRSVIMWKLIELYPESLREFGEYGFLPLHSLLSNMSSSVQDALMMIEKYPEALKVQNEGNRNLPIVVECCGQCRLPIISKCIELYPESLIVIDYLERVPLHYLLLVRDNTLSSVEVALFMIEKCPTALKYSDCCEDFPVSMECKFLCNFSIISRCFDLFPESLDEKAILTLVRNAMRSNFHNCSPVLTYVFTVHPMSLYDRDTFIEGDIRADPAYRRRILNLLPRHVFTSNHESDYRDLNWQPRSAIMTLFSQMKRGKSSSS